MNLHSEQFPLCHSKSKTRRSFLRVLFERLAATYSRGSYTTTTIGKAAFDGRVRNGIGSDHSFMATKLLHTAAADLPQRPNTVFCKRSHPKPISAILCKQHTGSTGAFHNSRVEIRFPLKGKAIEPHDRLVPVN